MFSLTTDFMEDQIALNKELQRLLAARTQKLEELLAIELQLISASKKVRGISPTHDTSLGAQAKVEPLSVLSHEEVNQPHSYPMLHARMTEKLSNEFGRKGSLPRLIGSFLQGKKQGEKLDSIVLHCLRSGYKSDSKDFQRIVTQALHTMKKKNLIHKDQTSQKFVLL